MIVNYEKISIIVMTNERDYREHYNLLRFLVKERLQKQRFSVPHADECLLEGDNFVIRFTTAERALLNRTWRCHFSLNLSGDERYKETVFAQTILKNFLDREKWAELF